MDAATSALVEPALEALREWLSVQAFWLVIAAWLADWATGTAKAVKYGEFTWRKFGKATLRLPLYVIGYLGAQFGASALGNPAPTQGLLGAIALKEAISAIQNLKALDLLSDQDSLALNKAIAFLGLDRYQSGLDAYQGKVQQARGYQG